MPRMLSIPVCSDESPAASSCAMTSGTFSIVTQRSCTCWRVVMSAMGASGGPTCLQLDLAEQAGLCGRHDAVGHADAHHEVAGRGLAVEDADPLQALGIVGS